MPPGGGEGGRGGPTGHSGRGCPAASAAASALPAWSACTKAGEGAGTAPSAAARAAAADPGPDAEAPVRPLCSSPPPGAGGAGPPGAAVSALGSQTNWSSDHGTCSCAARGSCRPGGSGGAAAAVVAASALLSSGGSCCAPAAAEWRGRVGGGQGLLRQLALPRFPPSARPHPASWRACSAVTGRAACNLRNQPNELSSRGPGLQPGRCCGRPL